MAFLCGSQVRPCGIRWPNSIIVKLFAHLALIMMQIFDMMMLFKWVDYANF